ncbi:MAG: hypothetical protein ABI480_15540 [Chitinophagaceae bacterium]
MKKAFFLYSFLFSFLINYSQQPYEPQILILTPNEVKYDKVFEKELAMMDSIFKNDTAGKTNQEKGFETAEFLKQPPNIQEMIKREVSYDKTIDFFGQVSFMSEQYLAYRFFEKFPNLMILLSKVKSTGDLAQLGKLATDEKLQYVLNFPRLEFFQDNGMSFAKLSVQLYNHTTNSLLMDTTYIGDWVNPGFEFSCKDSTLSCTISNSLSFALDDIIHKVAANSPTLKKEAMIYKDRLDVLTEKYYRKAFDRNFIKMIIPKSDTNINVTDLYQGMISTDKTKFVGFFLKQSSLQDFKQLHTDNKDKNVQIISGKNIKDSGFLGDIPQTYAYIVKGVKYKGKWYYEKSDVTYFEAEDDENGRLQFFNNLQEWNFFKENSTDLNPEFWETKLFAKVKDLRKDPDWNEFGETIWKTEEVENRPYIGMYEIVAIQLRGNKKSTTTHITISK